MRLRSLFAVMLVPALLVSGCGRGAAHSSARMVGPSAALNAGGEPQWSVLLRRGVLRVSAGDAPIVAVQAERADHGAAGVVWSGALPAKAGQPASAIRLTTLVKACQDASTGQIYPLSAVAEVSGRRYVGCAAPAGQGLGPRT